MACGQHGSDANVARVAGDIAVNGSVDGSRADGGAVVVRKETEPPSDLIQRIRREEDQ